MRKTIMMLWAIAVSCSLGFAELTPRERWVLSLTAIMSLSNQTSTETLEDEPITDASVARWRNILERDWGIHSREELITMIEKMTNDGHQTELALCQRIHDETSDYSYFNMINKYKLSQKQYNYLKYYLANYGLLKGRSILVWDLGRNIALCRWGFDSGYLSEEEAWEMMFQIANKIQPLYTSWRDYGFDYYMGRIFWASGFSSEFDYAYKTDKIYRSLIAEGGLWNEIEWSTKLDNES